MSNFNKIMRPALFILASSVLCSSADTDIYVSSITGADTNDGMSAATPLATVGDSSQAGSTEGKV